MNLWNLFLSEATIQFRFLETEYGFSLEEIGRPFLVYRSQLVRIRLYFNEEWRNELSLSVSRVTDAPTGWPEYGLSEFRAIAEGGPKPGGDLYPATPSGLADGLRSLADQVRTYCAGVLVGSEVELHRIDQMRAEHGMDRTGYGTLKRGPEES
jgi:hypothetical protein